MRVALATLFVIALASSAAAQGFRSRPMAVAPRPSIGLPLPSIGLPLPPIGLPLPPIGLSPLAPDRLARPVDGRVRPFDARARRFDDRVRSMDGGARSIDDSRPFRGRFEHLRGGGAVYLVPGWEWAPGVIDQGYADAAPVPGPAQEPMSQIGLLRVAVPPGLSAEVYIDGYYAGVVDSLNGELSLDAGLHVLGLRANGFEPIEAGITVPSDDIVTYRAEFEPVRPARVPPADAAPAVPLEHGTIYVIPGCYVGNVAPRDA